jgi:hypothetical protein
MIVVNATKSLATLQTRSNLRFVICASIEFGEVICASIPRGLAEARFHFTWRNSSPIANAKHFVNHKVICTSISLGLQRFIASEISVQLVELKAATAFSI